MSHAKPRNSSLVILTGAGISAESGLKTFRDANGLWENHRIEDVASIDGFYRDPALVQGFYNQRRRQLREATVLPNTAHLALADLEANWPGDFLLVTQNVDDLHDRAGSRRLLHMHGELRKARCLSTERVFVWDDDILPETPCPCCGKTGQLRPHIVWFGEMPLYLDEIYPALESCDVFAAIGTSGQVYPAAGFVQAVRPTAHTIEVNLDATPVSSRFDEQIAGPATRAVPELAARLLARPRP